MLYSNKPVPYNNTTTDRRTHNSNTAADITDDNLDNTIDKFQDQLKNEFIYRIPLRYFSDIGETIFPLQIDFKIKCQVEVEMKKHFESKKKVSAIGASEAKIIFLKAPFIHYAQFLLDNNFRQYTETIMISKKDLKNGNTEISPAKNISNACKKGKHKCL